MRTPVIGIMGGHSVDQRTADLAERLGEAIAGEGWITLTGGRNQGVMAAASRGAKRGGGLVIGVLPDEDDSRVADDVDIAICTGMGDARNVINVLSSNVIVACRGSLGTISEIVLALNHQRPVIVVDFPLGEFFDEFRRADIFIETKTIEATVDALRKIVAG
ncbi:MAG: TIGR00725 family protein [Planctomycetota bacterium]|jgi:uncharacterized protein (TIGR00725 family)